MLLGQGQEEATRVDPRLRLRLRTLLAFAARYALDAFLCVAIFVAVYRILLPHINPLLPSMRGPVNFWGDEGTVLYHAERIRQGEVLYRDFFDFQGLFGFLPFTIAFSIAPVSAETGRLTMFVLMAAWGSVTYLTVKAVTAKRWAAVLVALYFPLCVFPTWPYAYQHFIADLWITCAVLFAIYAERDAFERGWVVAGIFTALGLWTSLSEGGVAFASLLASCIVLRYAGRRPWRIVLDFAAGFGGVTALYALYLASRGALRAAIHAVLVFPFTSYGENNKTEYGFDGVRYVTAWLNAGEFEGGVVQRLVDMTMKVPKYGVVVSLLVALVLLDRVAYRRHTRRVKRRGIPWPVLSACVLVASLGALAVPVWGNFTRSDIAHIGAVQQMSVLALTVLWAPISKENLTRWRWRVVWGLQAIAGVYVLSILYDTGKFHRANAAQVEPKSLTAAIRAHYNCPILEARTRPDDSVVVNYGGWAHLVCGRKSAISFPHLMAGPYWDEMWPVAAREIVARKPRVLMLTSNDFQRLTRHEPAIAALYIGMNGNYMLAEGRPGPPWTPAEWRYTSRGPAGTTVRGHVSFYAGVGAPPFTAHFDDREESAFTYLDGATVQIFANGATYILERDETGRSMTGFVYEGKIVRTVEAEIERPL